MAIDMLEKGICKKNKNNTLVMVNMQTSRAHGAPEMQIT